MNVSLRYDVKGSTTLTKDLVLTAVVNNVFDNAPPINRTTNGSTTNGNTLGRAFQFGIEKRF